MEYRCRHIRIPDVLNFWEEFEGQERMLFYHPIKKKLIIGAVKWKTVTKEEGYENYINVFYPKTFFYGIQSTEKEKDEEGIVFQYYLIAGEKDTVLYYRGEPIQMTERKVSWKKNSYHICNNDYEEWERMFRGIKQHILNHEVKKVVISRRMELEGKEEYNIPYLIKRLYQNNKNCFIFAYYKDGETFLGASPEILAEKTGNHILSYALAGTIAKNGKNDLERGEWLLHDEKNNYEHRIVVDAITNIMKEVTSQITIGKTKLMELKNLFHLHTVITADAENMSLLEWVKKLHPTPAMGGEPREKAINLIKQYEPYDRGWYAAPIGIVDQNGDGVFVVGIRSALIKENKVYAYAGCGIVEQSDCREEYEETSNKFRTIMECL